MPDFTVNIYKSLLTTLIDKGYCFITFREYFQAQPEKFIILRHDVDARKHNSLEFASLQHQLGIRGTYYFRIVPESFDEKVILQIASMGHEIGYHYEISEKVNGNIDLAYQEFCSILGKFRKLVPVRTICMHGSPTSRIDNKSLWGRYDYRKLDIIGEPYLDIDFNNVFYLTDTGRRWDGYNVSVRDKIPVHQERWDSEGLKFRSTREIIHAANDNRLPKQIMMTFHPQRWHSDPVFWFSELLLQKTKNLVKKYLIKFNPM